MLVIWNHWCKKQSPFQKKKKKILSMLLFCFKPTLFHKLLWIENKLGKKSSEGGFKNGAHSHMVVYFISII